MDALKPSRLEIRGEPLSIAEVAAVGAGKLSVELTCKPSVVRRIEASVELIRRAVTESWSVYGVTTGFGGMADVPVPSDLAAASQQNLLSFLAAGAGDPIDGRHVRSAMLLRANVLLQGRSGVRLEIIERLVRFLEAGATPVVRELGSIGASGDLIPLSTIARAITGHNNRVRVTLGDATVDASTALERLNLPPLSLQPKEGLAIVNGTSFSSAVAANAICEGRRLMGIALATHAMMLQALEAHTESFDEFVHQQKPHPGQIWTAKVMRSLLRTHENTSAESHRVQDRYSLRCLPQYLGPVVETFARVGHVVETEMNSVSDNPLVDSEEQRFYQNGNFLGQYIGIAMDDLRRCFGLMAKHLDVQIATLVAPEFNHGLPPSLRGNEERSYNMGLKGLQITANSIAPTLCYYGNPIVEHFPTHAEQFNQNINGLSWTSANLAWRSVELFRHYDSVALIFAVQALDLRTKQVFGHFDGRRLVGSKLAELYETVCGAMHVSPGENKPFLFNDSDVWLEEKLALVHQSVCEGGLDEATECIMDAFEKDLC